MTLRRRAAGRVLGCSEPRRRRLSLLPQGPAGSRRNSRRPGGAGTACNGRATCNRLEQRTAGRRRLSGLGDDSGRNDWHVPARSHMWKHSERQAKLATCKWEKRRKGWGMDGISTPDSDAAGAAARVPGSECISHVASHIAVIPNLLHCISDTCLHAHAHRGGRARGASERPVMRKSSLPSDRLGPTRKGPLHSSRRRCDCGIPLRPATRKAVPSRDRGGRVTVRGLRVRVRVRVRLRFRFRLRLRPRLRLARTRRTPLSEAREAAGL